MRILAFNGSPRPEGNTARLIRHCFAVLEQEGIETELIQVGGSEIRPCRGCDSCRRRGVDECAIADPLNGWYRKAAEADGFLLASPTYCWGPTPEMKALLDRFVYLAKGRIRTEGHSPFRYKVGAAVSVDGLCGAPMAVQAMHTLFMTTQMIVPGATSCPIAKGFAQGDVEGDSAGLRHVEDLARNMAWLLKKLHS